MSRRIRRSARHGFLPALRLAGALALVAALLAPAALAHPAPVAAADFTASYSPGTIVYDEAGVLGSSTPVVVPQVIAAATERAGVDPVFYVHRVPDAATADASQDASWLVGAWLPTWPQVRDTLVVVLDVAGDPACPVDIGARVGPAWSGILPQSAVDALMRDQLRSALTIGCDPDMIMISAAGGLEYAADQAAAGTGGGSGSSAPAAPGVPDAPPAGPPWPEPVAGQRVYDYAGIFTPETEAATQATIDRIEQRTGAQVVVYTQVKPDATSDSTEQDAISLMDTWGVGRKGFDDGLVILWNMQDNLQHGQIQLYAGPGFRNLVDNGQRQAIFENDMMPYLQSGDLDGAMTIAMQKLDELATSENAARLQFFRILDAAIGLILAPLVFLLIAGRAALRWYRRGRDPQVTQSQSLLMPAPPDGMTPAVATVVRDEKASRRSLTTAMLDLASRGEVAFQQTEEGVVFKSKKLSIDITDPDPSDARVSLNRRAPVGPAEQYILGRLQSIGGATRHIDPDDLLKLGKDEGTFDSKLEKAAVAGGFFAEPPSTVRGRWMGGAFGLLVLGIIMFVIAVNLPSGGFTLLGVAFVASAIVMFIAGAVMPARTQAGALARVWLDGYLRTLKATMAQARSMDEVVAKSGLDWLLTPDRAVVWGTALGLEEEIEAVLARSVEDLQAGTSPSMIWLPMWYAGSSGTPGWGQAGGGVAPGLMSGSAIPDFGGMMAALGTIGNSPGSSGSGGGGGGFGGGGSGGGGGGAGGGF